MQVKVLRNQLWMLHGAFAAHSLSCQNFLEKNIQEAGEHLNNVSTDVPSFLEESWHSKATTNSAVRQNQRESEEHLAFMDSLWEKFGSTQLEMFNVSNVINSFIPEWNLIC